MFAMVDAFIGLIFVYLTLSLIVTAIGEALTGLLGTRGHVLREGVERLVGRQLAERVASLPRFATLVRKEARGGETPDRPSLWVRIGRWWHGRAAWPSYLEDALFVDLLLEVVIGDTAPEAMRNPARLDRELRAALEEKPELAPIKDLVSRAWREADLDVERFKTSLGRAFNATQDRAVGWFKRRLAVRLFTVGLIVAVFLNADTIQMFRTLSTNEDLRNQYVSSALEALASREGGAGADGSAAPATDAQIESLCRQIGIPEERVAECDVTDVVKFQAAKLDSLIGWDSAHPVLIGVRTGDGLLVALALSVVGWLLTAAALSLGAPFWFDMLQKLVKVRSALAPAGGQAPAPTAPGSAGGPATPAAGPGDAPAPPDLDRFASFHATKLELDLVNALWLARFAALAYDDGDRVRGQLEDWGLVGDLHESEHDTQFIVAESPRTAVLAFRGTEPTKLQDIVTDARFDMTTADWAGDDAYRVHSGFLRALDDSWDAIRAALSGSLAEGRSLWICGHSLGGALALLAAARLLLDGGADRPALGGVYTFGQPRAMNDVMADRVERLLGGRLVRAVNNRDVVPLVPPPVRIEVAGRLSDYRHIGRIIYFNDFGQMMIDPSLWFRALDKVALGDAERIKAKLKEAGGDHAMSEYLRLVGKANGLV